MMSTFLNALHTGRVLLMDGAMGTELQKLGLKPGECGEEWNVTHPDRVASVHRAYVEAGARVLLTNTFQANHKALERCQSRYATADLISAAIELAHSHSAWVIGDIGPFEESGLPNDYRYGCSHIVVPMTGCDAILVETISDTNPLVSVVKANAAAKKDDVFLASATFLRDDSNTIRTYSGLTPAQWAQKFENLMGIAAIGGNCGRDIGMKECVEIVQQYRDNTSRPIFVRPNAGTPKFRNEQWIYPHSPEYMASWLPELLEAGATMIGGCCGTTPAHIAAFKKVIDEWNQKFTFRAD